MTDTGRPSRTARHRPTPRDGQRVLLAYAVAVGSLAIGLPALVAGWFGASRCSGGLECLGWLVYGMAGMGLIAVVALVLLAGRVRLGSWWALLTIALVAAPLALGDSSLFRLPALLGPAVAAWVTQPLVSDAEDVSPLGPPRRAPDPVRTYALRCLVALLVAVVLPLLSRLLP